MPRAIGPLVVAILFAFPLLLGVDVSARSASKEKIERAETSILAQPNDRRAHLELAKAWTERGRETAEHGCYQRALESLAIARKSPRGDPPDSELALVEAWARLGLHEFERAESLARAVVNVRKTEPAAWGVWGDALMELGRYDAAASAYQEMLNLKPGPSSYVRAAHFRELIGDRAGALELLEAALIAIPSSEPEQRAWTLVQMANIRLDSGEAPEAGRLYSHALDLVPGYHYALAGLARVALLIEDAPRAEELARAAFVAAPHPEHRLLIADALRRGGRPREARAEEDAFEREALANVEKDDNENLFLVDYYLDRRPFPSRALTLARREARRRSDLTTLGRLIRALDRTGAYEEARRVEGRVLAVKWKPTIDRLE